MESTKGSAGNKLRVLMLVENSFPGDIRLKNEAFTLRDAGHPVTVIALRAPGERFREDVEGVRVYRVPKITLFKKLRANGTVLRRFVGKLQVWCGYFTEYLYFTTACLMLSGYIAVCRGFDVIHAHNPPDTLFVVGAAFKLAGKKFVFDHHDLSPELYLSRFGLERRGGAVYRTLLAIENLSLRLSDVCIATNESYRQIDVERGKLSPDRVFVVRNGPDLRRVRSMPPDERLRRMGRTVLAYLGAMNPQDGIDCMLRALHHLAYTLARKDFYCVAIGAGDSLEELKDMAARLGLEDYVWFTGYVSDEALMRYVSAADICLDPNPSSPLNDVSTWIKVMEYMALEKPIVSFDLKETRYTAQSSAVYAWPNDELEFARKVALLMDDEELRRQMGEFGRRRIEDDLQWNVVSRNLLMAYEALNGKAWAVA